MVSAKTSSDKIDCDVCVVGAGSAGIGAALAAARSGLATVLVERGECLGGNAVRGGVHNWEPGIGGTAFPHEIYRRLCIIPLAAGVWSFGRHWCWADHNDPPFPGGESLIDPSREYEDTLQRHGTRGLVEDFEHIRELWHGVIFEPETYAETVEEMLRETGYSRILKQTELRNARADDHHVTEVLVAGQGGKFSISARYYIDTTADGLLGQAVGCEFLVGEESSTVFDEPSAPETGNPRQINAVTLIYRITPASSPRIEELPPDVAAECWFRNEWGGAYIGQYPCGDRNINMLPTMEGPEFLQFIDEGTDGYRRAYEECRRRVIGHWHFVQMNYPEFRNFCLQWIAPTLGVRETRRVIAEYMLTENDLTAGLSGQNHTDIIAIADHAFDVHGQGNRGCPELEQPYGVPYRCLIPKGWRNLLVAGRCAGFSHIAASSCRLSRTMMDLGHAAGLASAIACHQGANIAEIDVSLLRRNLKKEGATLDFNTRGQLATVSLP